MADSAIEWCDRVWNPVLGCARVSPGCEHCYAETMARRLATMPHSRELYSGLTTTGKKGARWTGVVRTVPDRLIDPLRWRKPARIFVNSMSDLFHEDVPNEYIAAVFGVMADCSHHTFQLLTKRAARLPDWFAWAESEGVPLSKISGWAKSELNVDGSIIERGERWPLPNVHLGVSCENQETADERIPYLLAAPAAVHWVSAEPLLGPVDLGRIDAFHVPPWPTSLPGEPKTFLNALTGTGLRPSFAGVSIETSIESRIDWVVVGGESGQRARPCDISWIRSIVDQCKAAGVPAFVKQLGARPQRTDIGLLPGEPSELVSIQLTSRKGGNPAEWPDGEWPREFPRSAP